MRQLQNANVHRNVVKAPKASGLCLLRDADANDDDDDDNDGDDDDDDDADADAVYSGHASADVVPIEERLFHEADNRDAIRERARRCCPAWSISIACFITCEFRYKEEQELSKTCTFKPNVDQTGSRARESLDGSVLFSIDVHVAAIVDSGSWRPIHERIGELQRQKVTAAPRASCHVMNHLSVTAFSHGLCLGHADAALAV
jgi:hypothetical protein